MLNRIALFSSLLLFCFSLGSCGNVVTNTSSPATCQPNTVLILVGDNYFNPFCGCQEIAGATTAPARSNLTCTFASGSTIVFDFTGTTQSHQIRFSAGTLPDTPLYNYLASQSPSSFGFQVSTAGNYSFYDSINPTLSGTLIAL